jgi:hypothetical protein
MNSPSKTFGQDIRKGIGLGRKVREKGREKVRRKEK